jgi:LPXTG-motif cell wall-anchored protein
LTKDGAESLAYRELNNQLKKIQNHYKITEISTGNDNLLVDSEYAEGKEIVVDGEHSWFKDEVTGEWPDTQSGQYENFGKAYKITVTDKYKKVTVTVKKKDGYSSDKKAHGDAALEGAVFQLYEDAACTKSAVVFDSTGKKKQADAYFVKDGKFETDYMRCGTTYYLKEVKAPNGYLANTEVFPIAADGKNYSIEFTPDSSSITVENQPILGKVALRKYMSDGSAGIISIEKNAQFQIYLKAAGSYDKADDYSRDTITTNEEGYACTKNLYYGEYTVHQVSTGGKDTEKVADFDVIIEAPNRSEPYLYNLNNPVFKAYLRVVKKDGNTEKTVLKPGTAYQIYQVNQSTGEETLVTQEYSDGHCMQKVDSFQTDDTGTILTVSTLSSGKYRIYEKQGAEGYHISNAYIEVEISSDGNNYTSETDVNGKTYTVVTADYINQETYGKLSLKKTGEQLKDFENGVFTYELTYLNGVRFEIYAREDIPTQDNQGTNWFEKDELVGTLTTGEGVKFEKSCGGICQSTVDENGTVTVHLPLGKYRVVEKKTNYGYILSKQEWNVDFQWENDKNEYVIDASGQTDENGVLSIKNERARAAVSLGKVDAVDRAGVSGALFGLYTKDAIYNSSGDKIVEADALLGTVRTEKDGKADFDLDLPLMSELNSGDYYIQELDAPEGYYCSGEKQSLHLEYKDDSTEVISYYAEIEDTPTSVEIDKKSVTGGEEVPGCQLRVDDFDGNMVIQWISGQKDSIQISEQAEKLGYQNLKGELDEKGNLHIRGLFKDKKYVLTEVRPADGYVTADSIAFQVTQNQVVTMYDDTTKVEFSKLASDTKKLLTGAKIGIYDSKGSEIYSFTTKKNLPVQLYGILKVGETYTFREIEAPSQYSKAEDVSFTVEDTGEIQKVVMTDKKLVVKKKEKTPTTKLSTKVPKSGTTPKQPKTGSSDVVLLAVVLMILSGGSFFIGVRKRIRIRF